MYGNDRAERKKTSVSSADHPTLPASHDIMTDRQVEHKELATDSSGAPTPAISKPVKGGRPVMVAGRATLAKHPPGHPQHVAQPSLAHTSTVSARPAALPGPSRLDTMPALPVPTIVPINLTHTDYIDTIIRWNPVWLDEECMYILLLQIILLTTICIIYFKAKLYSY